MRAQNDVLMWLMYEAKDVEKSVKGLANLASIHSTSLVRAINPSLAACSHGVDGYASVVPPPLTP